MHKVEIGAQFFQSSYEQQNARIGLVQYSQNRTRSRPTHQTSVTERRQLNIIF